MLTQQTREMLDPFLMKKLASLGIDAERAFEKRFLDKKKSGWVAFLLSLFCLHRFYYGQIGLGILFILVFLTGVGVLWLIYDWCTMNSKINQLNDNLAVDILQRISACHVDL